MFHKCRGFASVMLFGLAFILLALSPRTVRGEEFGPIQIDSSAGYTSFTVPFAAKPPKIDGKIEPGEWDHAVTLNLSADQSFHGSMWRNLYARWTKWSLMWDADNIYLCSESQRLPNENLIVNERDQTMGGNTVFDDSIEVHFTPGGRNVINNKLPWSAQAILNPLGVGYYSKFTWAVAARTTAWVPDWRIGSEIGSTSWVIELAIPRKSLDLPEFNRSGDEWSFLMARNWKLTGWNQSTIPSKIDAFAVVQQHPRAYLTDGAYARVEDVSGLLSGKIRATLSLGAGQSRPEKVTVSMLVASGKLDDAAAKPIKWEKTETVNVAPGTTVAWRVDEPDVLPAGEYRCYIKVNAEGSKHPALETNFYFVPGSDAWLVNAQKKLVSEPYRLSATFAPTVSRLRAYADLLFAPDKKASCRLNVTVHKKGDRKPLFTGSTTNQHESMLVDEFSLPVLKPGEYVWSLSLVDTKVTVLAFKEGAFKKKDEVAEFPWYGFQGARADKVLWPYQPIKVENGGARSSYWGGDYYLNGLCLPRQLSVTANQEWVPELLRERPSVLARGVSLTAEQDGKPVEPVMQGFPRTTSVKEHAASMIGFGQIGSTVELQSNAEFSQDGLLWITLTMRPAMDSSSGKDVRMKEAKLDRLTIDIPIVDTVARSMNAYGEPGYGSFTIGDVAAGNGVVWDCTRVGRSVMADGDVLPMVWLGNDQRGLVFLAENNLGWVHDRLPDEQIIRNPGEVVLRLNVIQKSITLTGDRVIRFGFLPTPMRKMVPGWRMLDCNFSQNFGEAFSTGRLPSPGAPYTGSLMPASYQKSRKIMFNNTGKMISTPGGSEYAPHTERGGYQVYSTDRTARGYFDAEWDENTWTKQYQDHLLWYMQKWINDGGLTGLYHDQFYATAVANASTGAAYRLADGRTNRGYNLLLDRELQMREHALFSENGIQPRIFCHTTNGGQLIAYPWVSAVLDGEDNMIVSNANYDFVDIYPPARMQAYGNPWNWGNTFYWMRLIQNGEPAWRKKQDRAYTGWTLLHDVMFASGGDAPREDLFDWGMNDHQVKYWPYWRSEKIVYCSDPDVLVSMWTLPDRVLICAFNTNKTRTARDMVIRIPLVDLGMMPRLRSEYLTGYDVEKAYIPFDAWTGEFKATVLPHDFRLLVIRKYTD